MASPVGSPDHHDIIRPCIPSSRVRLGDNSSFDLATDVFPLWCNGVKLMVIKMIAGALEAASSKSRVVASRFLRSISKLSLARLLT